MPEGINSEAAVTDDMLDAAAAEVEELEEEAAEDKTSQQDQDGNQDQTDDGEEKEDKDKEEPGEESEIGSETGDEEPEEIEGEGEEDEGELPEEPEDNAARSKLGRKVAAMFRKQDRVEEILDKLTSLLEKSQVTQPVQDEEEEEFFDEDEPLTPKKLEEILEKRERQREEQAAQYENGYIKKVAELGSDLTPEEHEEIVNEMMANFNVRYTNNPELDAERNYLKAERAVLRKKLAKPKKSNPLKGEKPRSPLGVANNQKVEKKSPALPDLDPEAKAFLESIRRKEGDEAAAKLHKSLLEPTPSYLAGTVK